MRSIRDNRKRLQRLLAEVYRQKSPAAVQGDWQARVLSQARRIERARTTAAQGHRRPLPWSRRWLVPVTGLAMAGLIALAVMLTSGIGNQPYPIAMNDPVEVVVAQLFWP